MRNVIVYIIIKNLRAGTNENNWDRAGLGQVSGGVSGTGQGWMWEQT